MIVVRTVLQAKFGKAGELAANFGKVAEQLSKDMGAEGKWRILTDLSGPFDTVVQEIEVENLAAWEASRAKLFQQPAFRESFAVMQELVVSGRNELWTLEAEG